MDPEKAFAAVAKALGLEEGASPEQVLRKLQAIVDYLAADSEPEPPAPAEEAEASNKPEDAVEASADADDAVELADTPDDTVELAEEPAPEVDPAAGELSALVAELASEMGTDEASALTALRERLPEVAALLSGQPADGTPATDAEAADMSRAALEASRANTAKAKAELKASRDREAKLAKRIDKLEADGRKARVDAAITAGHIAPGSAKPYYALARTGGEDFEALMSEAAESPEVITGVVAGGKGSDIGAADNVAPDVDESRFDNHPKVLALTRALGEAAGRPKGQRALVELKQRLAGNQDIGRA